MNKPKQPIFQRIADEERFELAKKYANNLVNHVASLFAMNEANRHIIYGDTLSKQIPRSYAAHAFNQFQQSMHLFEVVRLCALWDNPAKDRESIPTVLELIDKTEITERAIAKGRALYENEIETLHLSPVSNPEHQAALDVAIGEMRQEMADEEASKISASLEEARRAANEIIASPELAALRRFRDSYIAHNLSLPELDPEKPTEVRSPRYGDENKILRATVVIADRLHKALNGTSFDWEGSQRIAAENATALWGACRFVDIDQTRLRRPNSKE